MTVLPVALDDAMGGHPPRLEVGTDAERNDEDGTGQLAELTDGVHVEVVVVVVRDDDGINPAQTGQRHRRRVQPLGPDVLARAATVAPDRIEQDPSTVELDQARRVPEPGDVQTVWARLVRSTDDRDRPGRFAGLSAVPEAAQHVPLP